VKERGRGRGGGGGGGKRKCEDSDGEDELSDGGDEGEVYVPPGEESAGVDGGSGDDGEEEEENEAKPRAGGTGRAAGDGVGHREGRQGNLRLGKEDALLGTRGSRRRERASLGLVWTGVFRLWYRMRSVEVVCVTAL